MKQQTMASAKQKAGRIMMNPMIRKISRIEEQAPDHSATYGGIAGKTFFFMLVTAAGVAGYFILHQMLAAAGSRQIVVEEYSFYVTEIIVAGVALLMTILAPLIALLIRPLIPIFGTIYCAGIGYTITMLSDLLGAEYSELLFMALGITILLVAVMACLYASGFVKVGKKFRAIVTALFLTAVFGGVIVFALSFVPGVGQAMSFLGDSPVLSIVMGVIYVVIACAFLLVDFDTIQRTVENHLPKKYEWAAAFGLAYTVIFLFLKVFDLLSNLKSQSSGQS